ncbi:ParA family protein (plasmid) [Kitasatospora purpeofusca]|uniref:ParA family protein n=1 Tax=Kitasatospora purpeofusca TaxID=67352 RepID=UPI002E1449FB|nr:ParA family protein [Kitasatospora purpeofusca]
MRQWPRRPDDQYEEDQVPLTEQPRIEPAPGGPPGAGEVTVVAMLKGGAGKTTSAMYLATVLRALGSTVVVVDADSVSQTAYGWARDAALAGTPLPFEVERYPFPDLGEYVTQLRKEYQHVLVDVGGGNAALLADVLEKATRLIVSLTPSGFDQKQIAATFKQARSAAANHEGSGFAVYVLLVRCDGRTNQPALARRQLEADERPVLETEIPQRVEYERAIDTRPANLDDYRAVWNEITEAEAE